MNFRKTPSCYSTRDRTNECACFSSQLRSIGVESMQRKSRMEAATILLDGRFYAEFNNYNLTTRKKVFSRMIFKARSFEQFCKASRGYIHCKWDTFHFYWSTTSAANHTWRVYAIAESWKWEMGAREGETNRWLPLTRLSKYRRESKDR